MKGELEGVFLLVDLSASYRIFNKIISTFEWLTIYSWNVRHKWSSVEVLQPRRDGEVNFSVSSNFKNIYRDYNSKPIERFIALSSTMVLTQHKSHIIHYKFSVFPPQQSCERGVEGYFKAKLCDFNPLMPGSNKKIIHT